MQEKVKASYKEATGVIQYNMTNNYMFRYILQENKKVLKGLISAVLHLDPSEIQSVEIQNPINLSEDVEGKEFILDIRVMLNDNKLINLEMQLNNKYDWPERSLSYLCRNYDQLYRGQEYREVMPVYHIGFLDFTLFPDKPEFYATYKMMNVKNHHLYSDKLTVGVVDLNRTDLATDEDKIYKIDYWARLFKAKTWEDLQMLAKNNEYLEEAAESIYKANADDILMQKCRAREEAERYERIAQRTIQLLQDENTTLKEEKTLLQDEKTLLQDEKTLWQDEKAVMQDELEALRKRVAELEQENN